MKKSCMLHRAIPLLLATAAFAEPVAAEQVPAPDYAGLTSGGSLTAPDTIPSSGFEDTDAKAQLSNEGDQLNADFSFTLNRASAPKGNQETVSGTFFSLSVKASLPLNGTKAGSIVDFKTFGNNGKVSLGFNFFRPTFVTSVQDYPVIVPSERRCIVLASNAWSKDGHNSAADQKKASLLLAAFDKASTSSELGVFEMLDEATGVSPADGTLAAFVRQRCGINPAYGIRNDSDIALLYASDTLDPAAYAAWRRKHRAEGTVYFGGEVSLGYNRFEVVDRPTTSIIRPERVGFDANGHVGYILPGASTMLLVEGGFTRAYTAQDAVDVCGPPDPQGRATCVNGQDGLPTRKDTAYIGGSWRQILLRNKYGQPILGMKPSVTYVREDKAWQFALPVYFQRSDTGGLDGGIKATYNTDKDKFSIGAFVGVPF